jgi:hypothetical protein
MLESEEARERLMAADEAERFNRLFYDAVPEVITEMNALVRRFTGSADESSALVSGVMGELAYMARRQPLSDPAVAVAPIGAVRRVASTGPSLATGRALSGAARTRVRSAPETSRELPVATPPATSPVFAQGQQVSGQLTLRPLQVVDVQRVDSRFAAEGVSDAIRGPELRAPALRSVLATSGVVPELAVWMTTPAGVAEGGVDYIATLAASADVSKLRALASTVTLFPPQPDPVLLAMAALGELDSMMALREVGHSKFLTTLDKVLSIEGLGELPVFVSWVLMRLFVVGYRLKVSSDAEAEALQKAIDAVDGGAGQFVAPNGEPADILAKAKHSSRDRVLRAAAKLPPEIAAAAQKRLRKAGFDSKPGSVQSVLAHRLLALAASNIKHIEVIAEASGEAFKAFAKAAAKAVESRSLVAMKAALKLAESPGRTP